MGASGEGAEYPQRIGICTEDRMDCRWQTKIAIGLRRRTHPIYYPARSK